VVVTGADLGADLGKAVVGAAGTVGAMVVAVLWEGAG
jgi:hypothetical protein